MDTVEWQKQLARKYLAYKEIKALMRTSLGTRKKWTMYCLQDALSYKIGTKMHKYPRKPCEKMLRDVCTFTP